MKIRIAATLLFVICALGLAVNTSADGITKRVKFAKGKSSTTVSGAVIRGDQDTYILGAGVGQKMSVRITSTEDNAVFQVMDDEGNYLPNAGEGDDATEWSGKLSRKGDYRIVVGGTRGNATYRMTVAIN